MIERLWGMQKKEMNVWSYLHGGREEASTVVLPRGEQVPSSALDVLGDFVYP